MSLRCTVFFLLLLHFLCSIAFSLCWLLLFLYCLSYLFFSFASLSRLNGKASSRTVEDKVFLFYIPFVFCSLPFLPHFSWALKCAKWGSGGCADQGKSSPYSINTSFKKPKQKKTNKVHYMKMHCSFLFIALFFFLLVAPSYPASTQASTFRRRAVAAFFFLHSLTSLSLNCCPIACVLFTAVRGGEFFQIFGASFEPEKRTPSGLVGVPYRWWIADGCLIKLQPIGSLPGAVVPFSIRSLFLSFCCFCPLLVGGKDGSLFPITRRGVWSSVLHFHLRFALAVDKGKAFFPSKVFSVGQVLGGFVPTA